MEIDLKTIPTRLEADSVGKKEVPAAAYYGVQTLRAQENFPITGRLLEPELIRGHAVLKKACALANKEAGILTAEVADAIVKACDAILEGKFLDEFIVHCQTQCLE